MRSIQKIFKLNVLKALIIVVAVIAFDLATKEWAMENLRFPFWLWSNKVGFLYAENYGIAFSIPFKGVSLLITNVVILTLIIYLLFNALQKREYYFVLPFSLIIGGAIGNMIDRFRFGYVVDFIALWNFPVFNIADSALTIGVALIIWRTIKQK